MKLRMAAIDLVSKTAAPFETTEIFVQGCNVQPKCKGCWNPTLWSLDAPAREFEPEELARILIETAPKKRLTICGGEPFTQAAALAQMSRILKKNGFFIMSYSGWTLEELLAGDANGIPVDDAINLLRTIDVLVDGRYDASERNPRIGKDFEWVGSANQRVIFVKPTLMTQRVYTLTVPQLCELADGRLKVEPQQFLGY